MRYRFEAFELDTDRLVLSRHGGEPIHLEPRVFDLLRYLVENQGRTIGKEELVEKVWGGAFVTDSAIKRALYEARRAIGEDGVAPRHLLTAHGRGYRFEGPAVPLEADSTASEEAPAAEPPTLSTQEPAPLNAAVTGPPARRAGLHALALWLAPALLLGGILTLLVRDSPPPVPSRTGAGQPAIAVFELDNLGPTDTEFLARGLGEEIAAGLVSVPGLSVLSRSSSLHYDRSGKTLAVIGRELGIAYALDGSVRTSDVPSRVRVTIQLSSVAEDRVLWTNSYDAPLDGAFELQRRIATEVIRVLAPGADRLAAHATSSSPIPEAYVAYLRGLEHERFFADALPLAADLFHRATTLDPQFAAAWARLSIADSALYHRGIDRSPQRLDRARHAAGAALELEPELAEAHRAVGYVAYWGDRDYDRALEAFGRAAELGGADADTLADTAYVLRRQGRFDEALERLRVAARLDPLSATRRLVVADTLMFMHRNAEAERHFERAIALEPDLPLAYGLRAINHLLWDGSVERARSTLDEMPAVRAPWATLYTAWVELAARRVESVEQTLAASPTLLLEADHLVVPVAELTARAFELAGDAPTSREAWQRAQALLERELAARPNDPRIQGALGVALAALGRADTALSHGRRATEIEPLTRDAFVAGTMRLQQLAEIHARLGQSSEAVAILTDLVARPSWISPAWLAVDPAWDSLRAEPGFQALVRPAARP